MFPKISAAMQTSLKVREGFYRYGKFTIARIVASSLMVHVEGHGPRRVYVNRHTGKSFIMIRGKRKTLSDSELSSAYEKATDNPFSMGD